MDVVCCEYINHYICIMLFYAYLSLFNKAFSVLGVIKRNFIHMDKSTFVLLYKAMVRPHLKYSNSVWCPFKKGDIENIEKVQKRATKLVRNSIKWYACMVCRCGHRGYT